MQVVDLPVISNSACESMFEEAGYDETIPDIFICAGYAAGGKDSCEVCIYLFEKAQNLTFHNIKIAQKGTCIESALILL